MDYTPCTAPLDGTLDVKHLMEHQVLDHIARDLRRVKQPADGDARVRRVVVAEDGAGAPRTPAEARGRQRACEVAAIQVVENLRQVETASARRTLHFMASAAARLLDPLSRAFFEDVGEVALARLA